ncbi:MAG: hypothetical protein R3297_06630, partial [Desulfobulbales bacterium]|nr:hypothetical protein [Desulfobulbales bacterium]
DVVPEPDTPDVDNPYWAQDEVTVNCQMQGCFTRTPGFWGSKRMITDEVINADPFGVYSCGLTLNNVLYEVQGSAVEDTCSTGNDKSYVDYEPQQIQLIRQCTAAALNAKASMMLGGSCASFDIGYDFDDFADAFATCCTEGCAQGEVGANCIKALDDFNNWESEDELIWEDMCEIQDNGKGGDNCGANNCNKGGDETSWRARNNGWVNCRPDISEYDGCEQP